LSQWWGWRGLAFSQVAIAIALRRGRFGFRSRCRCGSKRFLDCFWFLVLLYKASHCDIKAVVVIKVVVFPKIGSMVIDLREN